MGIGDQAVGSSSPVLPSHKQGAGSEVEQSEFEPVPIWHADTTGRGLTYCVAALSLLAKILEKPTEVLWVKLPLMVLASHMDAR